MAQSKWALYTARRLNRNWGFGNSVFRAGHRLGWKWVFDCDYRLEDHSPGFLLGPEVNHLVMKGELFTPESFKSFQGKVAFWYPDQVLGFPDRQHTLRNLCPLADCVFYMHQDERHFYEGLLPPEKLILLPQGADPFFHTPRDVVRDVSVGHVGNLSPRSGRPPYIEAFQRGSLPIETPRVYGEAMMEFYSRCKIVWNLGHGGGGIQLRFFEAMGAGALVVTNETASDTGSPFIPGEHLVTYTDIQDAIAKCRYYLEHEEERLKIVQAATEKLKSESVDSRLRKVESILQGL